MRDRKKIIASAKTDEEKILLSRACDLYEKSRFSNRPFFTKFLTPSEKDDIDMRFEKNGDAPLSFFGGYDDAERVMASFGETDSDDFPIKLIAVRAKNQKELHHRDVMGAILSLGIERETIGDILVDSSNAYIFVVPEMAEYIKDNLTKIASFGVVCEIKELKDAKITERKYEEKNSTLSSMRLDCVVSALCGKSRKTSSEFIERGLVSVNHKEVKSTSFSVKNNDIVTVRGEGKFLIKTDLNLTRRGRISIKILKYI